MDSTDFILIKFLGPRVELETERLHKQAVNQRAGHSSLLDSDGRNRASNTNSRVLLNLSHRGILCRLNCVLGLHKMAKQCHRVAASSRCV